jgi:hypothetical protein
MLQLRPEACPNRTETDLGAGADRAAGRPGRATASRGISFAFFDDKI